MLEVGYDPAGAINIKTPVCAPAGTLTRTALLLRTLKSVAGVEPNSTDVVPRKFVPVTMTFVPERPVAGENPVINGGAKKLLEVVNVPFVPLTVIGPEVTPLGAWIVRL